MSVENITIQFYQVPSQTVPKRSLSFPATAINQPFVFFSGKRITFLLHPAVRARTIPCLGGFNASPSNNLSRQIEPCLKTVFFSSNPSPDRPEILRANINLQEYQRAKLKVCHCLHFLRILFLSNFPFSKPHSQPLKNSRSPSGAETGSLSF